MIKIYVLDLIYVDKKGDEFLDNQIHFTALEKAKKQASEWLNTTKHTANKKYVSEILATISVCELFDEYYSEQELDDVEKTGYLDGASYDENEIVYEKRIIFENTKGDENDED